MSRRTSHDKLSNESTGVLGCIKEEQPSPCPSTVINKSSNISNSEEKENNETEKVIICPCKAVIDAERDQKHAEEIKRLLQEKEMEMEEIFKDRLDGEMEYLKDRFEYILHNEQVRASFMLREAYRERQEKISALQSQLECKNLAGVMYVLCSERRKCKMEKMNLCEEYTKYIQYLQKLLTDSQALILHLSRGYKTAARVDYEWREKMKKILNHFQGFVNDFNGGTTETNQFLYDITNWLKIKAPTEDNPIEDPCEKEDEVAVEENVEVEQEKPWYESLDGDHPFVMYGDISAFKTSERREILKNIKAEKSAPKEWKEYVFNKMSLKSGCPNAEAISREYFKVKPEPDKWECTLQMDRQVSRNLMSDRDTTLRIMESLVFVSRTSLRSPPLITKNSLKDGSATPISEASRRVTTASVDIRGNMGSIIKMITSSATPQTGRATLLGARDSMEIASTTKLKEKHRHTIDHSKVVLNIGNKIDSLFKEVPAVEEEEEQEFEKPAIISRDTASIMRDEEVEDESFSALGSLHNDSLQIIPSHVPDQDHQIHREKICPMEKCQKLHVDSFMRSLPAYMRDSPFTHFEQTYDNYEACSPEQLKVLQTRIEEKKKRERIDHNTKEQNPLLSWAPSAEGICVQTSDVSLSIPPCTCHAPSPTPVSSCGNIFTVADLVPIKQKVDEIKADCFFDNYIDFDRFKVIGQDESVIHLQNTSRKDNNITYKKRLHDIKKTLKHHPSLCEIFQANIRC